MSNTIELIEENVRLRGEILAGAAPLCARPWVGMEEMDSWGAMRPCCWFDGTTGTVREGTDVLAVWHGREYQELRRTMATTVPHQCDPVCPVLSSRKDWFEKQEFYSYSRQDLLSFDRSFLENRARVMRAYMAGQQLPLGTYPLRLKLHPSNRCNLRCTMCYLDLDADVERSWYTSEALPEMLQYLEEILVLGGEPLFEPLSRHIILELEKPAHVHTSFLTNGMLVTDRVVARLGEIRIGLAEVSLDAADAETYGRIRLRGNFTKALAGARRLIALGETHSIRKFRVTTNFTVQEANYRQLAECIELCAELGTIGQFTLLEGTNPNAEARSRAQGTELGRPPEDPDDLLREIDRALHRGRSLGISGAASALERMRQKVVLARDREASDRRSGRMPDRRYLGLLHEPGAPPVRPMK